MRKLLVSGMVSVLLGTMCLSAENGVSQQRGGGGGKARLNLEQKESLAYMWNEEKMAKDLYRALNREHKTRILRKIANRSETRHQAKVENLIRKYDLNILDTDTFAGGYSKDDLAAFGPGEFSMEEIQDLYDRLFEKGKKSRKAALKVGCIVEVTDIEDLDKRIETAQGANDLVRVYTNLRNGSYKHYSAFDRALKNRGVKKGCCVLGEEYCLSY